MSEEFVKYVYLKKTTHRCLDFLHEDDIDKFKKKFRKQKDDEKLNFHTARELALGAYLRWKKLDARYEQEIDSKTPDWCIYGASDICGVVELMNFHAHYERDDHFNKDTIPAGGGFVGWKESNLPRLYDRIQNKVLKYKDLVEVRRIFFVIGIFCEFVADVESQERKECFIGSEGLFNVSSNFSRVLIFKEGFANAFLDNYNFQYLNNPIA